MASLSLIYDEVTPSDGCLESVPFLSSVRRRKLKYSILISAIAIAIITTGCASTNPKFSGKTVASSQLKSDTLRIIQLVGLPIVKIECDRIESVETSILFVPNDIRGNSNGAIIQGGPIKERWLTSACGKQVAFIVTFIPAPNSMGGNFIEVLPEFP